MKPRDPACIPLQKATNQTTQMNTMTTIFAPGTDAENPGFSVPRSAPPLRAAGLEHGPDRNLSRQNFPERITRTSDSKAIML